MAKQQHDTDTTSTGQHDGRQATAPRDDTRSPEQGLAENNHGDQAGTDAVRIAIENTNSGPRPVENA